MSNLPLYGYVWGAALQFVTQATTSLPEQAVWASLVVLLILGAASTVDALTETVPDPLIFLGLFAITAIQGMYVSWPVASHHLMIAIVSGFVIWAVNEFWFRLLGEDILSMGDAKWTMLAVSCFDVIPVFYAWIFALSLGIVKVMYLRLARRKVIVISLAPFLFPGLIASLYILRVSDLLVK